MSPRIMMDSVPEKQVLAFNKEKIGTYCTYVYLIQTVSILHAEESLKQGYSFYNLLKIIPGSNSRIIKNYN